MKPDPLAALEQLAARIGAESSPSIDIADRVLETLHSRKRVTITEPEYAIVGFTSVLAACAALLIFWISVQNDDALLGLAQPFFTMLP